MELSNILKSIGADDVKFSDWSTAKPMLDIIPIHLYQCRLCQNSSIIKSSIVKHLSACHENEWSISSIRTKELMNIINKSRNNFYSGAEEPMDVVNEGNDDHHSDTKAKRMDVDVRNPDQVFNRSSYNNELTTNVSDSNDNTMARNFNSSTKELTMKECIEDTQSVKTDPVLMNTFKIVNFARVSIKDVDTSSAYNTSEEVNGYSQDQGTLLTRKVRDEEIFANDNDQNSSLEKNINSIKEITSISCRGDAYPNLGNSNEVTNDDCLASAKKNPSVIASEETPLNKIGRLATRINHPLFLASTLPERKLTNDLQEFRVQDTLNKNGERNVTDASLVLNTEQSQNNCVTNEGLNSLSVNDGVTNHTPLPSTVNMELSFGQNLVLWPNNLPNNSSRLNQYNRTPLNSPPKIHSCPHCPSRFTTKKALCKHQDIHSGVLLHCDLCDFTSVWNTSIKKHKQLKHFRENLPDLCCPQCSYITKNSDNMRRHKRTIHCGIDVLPSQLLHNNLIRNISVAKIYKCDHCHKTFTTNRAMKKHQDIHNGTLIKCGHCDFTSVWSASVKKHTLLKHFREDLPVLCCPHCDFKTKNNDNLRRHQKIIHVRNNVSAHNTTSNNPTNECVKSNKADVRAGQNESTQNAVLKSPKHEPTVYIEREAVVNHYFDVVGNHND